MALVYIHYGLVTDVTTTLINRLGNPADLSAQGTAVTVNIRTTRALGYTVQRTTTILDPQGIVKWSVLADDFGLILDSKLFLGTWDFWWSATPTPPNSPGRFPEGIYDTLWIVP